MGNVLFCGSYIPHEISYKVYNNSEAANNFQKELINNLKSRHQLVILTYISYKVENRNELEKSMQNNGISFVIKTRNYIKTIISYYAIFLRLIRKENIDNVILYNLTYINLLMNLICRFKGIQTTLILADFTDVCESQGLVRKIIAYITKKQFIYFNYRIVLSADLIKKIEHDNTLLMQGGIDYQKYKDFIPLPSKSIINILYSGTLEKVAGIELLLGSLQYMKKTNINLIISGRGSFEEKIKKMSQVDKRIKFVGFLEEKEFLSLLKNSHILINPRNMEMDQNTNNFPSKILEYLATGRPVISTKFSGYQYFINNIHFIDTDERKLAEAILHQIEIYETNYKEVFFNNRDFSKEFYWDNQFEKIEEFIFN